LANTKNYQDTQRQQKEKSKTYKFLGILFLFLIVFAAGVWVGDSYMPAIRRGLGRTARAPLEGVKNLVEGATSFASKEELIGAIEDNEDLEPNEKKRLGDDVKKAYEVKENYDGEYKAGVEQLWNDARKIYDKAREDGEMSGSEIRSVVAKLREATEAAQ